MGMKENEVLMGKGMKVTLANPKEMLEQKLAEKERIDKLNAMRIAMTHIETQGLKVDPKKATEIADEFLKWLKKK